MKQLEMTAELSALIKSRVGTDVDTAQLAVFETIGLNTRPLPGKRGAIFEGAVVSPLALKEIVDRINDGGHIPLIADHELFGAPKGRVFHAGLDWGDEGLELRALFYLDPTETSLITKLNAGTLDEVSFAFMSRQFLCSECGWDYFQLADDDNIINRTCGNGHKIGQNGVHGNMVGLNQLIELSLVARGAADKPKIVGKSDSKLAPAAMQVLAAKGFEVDRLVVQASIGTQKEDTMSEAAINALTAQLTSASTREAALTTQLTTATTERDTARTELAAANASIATLTAERDDAIAQRDARPEAGVTAERDAAIALLQDQLNALRVAKGDDKLEGDALPKTVAELKTQIDDLTAKLTAIIPTGGRSQAAGGENSQEAKLAFDPKAAYGLRK
jgi:hypothetical protein